MKSNGPSTRSRAPPFRTRIFELAMLRTHLADLSTEFLMQTLEEVLEPQLAENDDVKRVRKHVKVKQTNLGRRLKDEILHHPQHSYSYSACFPLSPPCFNIVHMIRR